MSTDTTTREQWLNTAVVRLNEVIAAKTALKPAKKVLVSAGWPRNDRKGVVIGQCYAKKASKGTHHVFVSPIVGSAVEVLGVLLHELIHAADDCESQHKGEFRKAWKALGYTGKPTENTPGPELVTDLKALAKELGKYPHSRLVPSESALPKQSTRMLKLMCTECEYVVRTTQKWLDTGLPTCHCGGLFEQEAK